jgi:hypothetical protein
MAAEQLALKQPDPLAAVDLLSRTLATERILAVSTLEMLEDYGTAIRAAVTYTLAESTAGNDVTRDLSAVLRWCAHLLVWIESDLIAARARKASGIDAVLMPMSPTPDTLSPLH